HVLLWGVGRGGCGDRHDRKANGYGGGAAHEPRPHPPYGPTIPRPTGSTQGRLQDARRPTAVRPPPPDRFCFTLRIDSRCKRSGRVIPLPRTMSSPVLISTLRGPDPREGRQTGVAPAPIAPPSGAPGSAGPAPPGPAARGPRPPAAAPAPGTSAAP